MERINFTYFFTDDDGEEHMISTSRKDIDDVGLRDEDICAMFFEFMRAVGFSENNVLRYFKT